MKLAPGTRFGHYEVSGLLGRGGMGEVYRARDTRLARDVALKILPEELAHARSVRERFEREGRLLAALTHPHVAAVYGLEKRDGVTALVLELVEGPMLAEWMVAEGRSLSDVLQVAGQIASALEAAHAHGIVHRDIKPSNVRISTGGGAKVLDFGIALPLRGAVQMDDAPTELTAPGAMVGTLGYLAPEQAVGGAVDTRADVWAFGALLFEMIARRPAFLRPTTHETLTAVLGGHASWNSLPPGVPAALRALLEDCLAVDVERRPKDGAALRARLGALSTEPATQLGGRSLLVLPFESMRGDDDNAAFGDGLTEEVIADLASIRDLRVFSRATALRYRGTLRDAALAARELGAGFVLDGSVRRAGNAVRVTVQLVDVSQDAPVWAEKYSGTLDDVFAIQETISRSIASALHLTLTGDKRFVERRRGNPAAYDVYLRTRPEIDSFSLPRLERARTQIEHALSVLGPDPYLYRALGRCAWQYMNAGFSHEPSHLATLGECITRLDAMDSPAHATILRALRAMVLGDIEAWYRALERAIAVDPGDTEMLFWKAGVLGWVGRTEEARSVARIAAEMDPLNEYVGFTTVLLAVLEGRLQEADRSASAYLESHPGSGGWPTALVQIRAMKGDREGARAVVETHPGEPPAGGFPLLAHVLVAALFGERSTVQTLLTPETERLMWNDFQYCHMIAESWALLERTDESLRWLQRAVDRGFWHHEFLAVDPLLAHLRQDPRFGAILRQARLSAVGFPGHSTPGEVPSAAPR